MPHRSRPDDRTAASSPAQDLVASQHPAPDYPAAAQHAQPLGPCRSTLALELDRTGADQVVGRFHYGTLLGNHPQALATWRVTSDHPHVVTHVAELLGVRPHTPGALTCGDVVTDAATVGVILGDPAAIEVRWYRNDERACDDRGECRCPPCLPDRKLAARAGRGCEPRVQIRFRLQQDADLGLFVFSSGSWSLVEDATRARRALRGRTGPVVAHLGLEPHGSTRRGDGRVAYTRPTLITHFVATESAGGQGLPRQVDGEESS